VTLLFISLQKKFKKLLREKKNYALDITPWVIPPHLLMSLGFEPRTSGGHLKVLMCSMCSMCSMCIIEISLTCQPRHERESSTGLGQAILHALVLLLCNSKIINYILPTK